MTTCKIATTAAVVTESSAFAMRREASIYSVRESRECSAYIVFSPSESDEQDIVRAGEGEGGQLLVPQEQSRCDLD